MLHEKKGLQTCGQFSSRSAFAFAMSHMRVILAYDKSMRPYAWTTLSEVSFSHNASNIFVYDLSHINMP